MICWSSTGCVFLWLRLNGLVDIEEFIKDTAAGSEIRFSSDKEAWSVISHMVSCASLGTMVAHVYPAVFIPVSPAQVCFIDLASSWGSLPNLSFHAASCYRVSIVFMSDHLIQTSAALGSTFGSRQGCDGKKVLFFKVKDKKMGASCSCQRFSFFGGCWLILALEGSLPVELFGVVDYFLIENAPGVHLFLLNHQSWFLWQLISNSVLLIFV